MPAFDHSTRSEAFARLDEVISIGREYAAFARNQPSEADAQIAAF